MDFICLENQGDRKEQQDAYFAQSNAAGLRLALVADGVGGQIGGRDAAQACKQIAQLWWHEHQLNPPPARDYLRGLFYNAHVRINEVAKRTGESPRAAVAAVLVQGGKAWLAHSGDCRIYVLRGDQLVHRSPDHSVVQMLLDRGKINEDQMGLHPDKGKLLQCVGGAEFAEPDIQEFPLQPGDRILLCSDGLWEHQTREGIRQAMAIGTKRALNDMMHDSVRRAAGKSDNIALIYLDAAGQLRGEATVPIWAVVLVFLLFGLIAVGFVMTSTVSALIHRFSNKQVPVVVDNPPRQRIDLVPDVEIKKGEPQKEPSKEEKPKVAPQEIVPSKPAKPEMAPPDDKTRPPETPKPAEPAPTGPRSIGFNKDRPIVNSLGMTFVYAGTPNVYMSAWETTVADWRAFIAAKPPEGEAQPLPENPLLPVSNLSASQAEAFCDWLTKKEQQEGRIGTEDYYDLPTDTEWITAASPAKKNASAKQMFPWGGEIFPPSKPTYANIGDVPAIKGHPAYTDPFPAAAPVRSFTAYNYGLYDMGGNVAEWTVLPIAGSETQPKNERPPPAPCLRGGGWTDNTPEAFSIYAQHSATNGEARIDSGFRCVLRISLAPPAAAPQGTAPTDAALPTKRAEPVIETVSPMTKPVGPIGPGAAMPKAGPNATATATILLRDDLAATASSYLRAINIGPDDRESLTNSLKPTITYNDQVNILALDVITALHDWVGSRGAGGAIRLIGASSHNPAPAGTYTSWLDLSVVMGDGKTRVFIQQVFFDPVSLKISKLGPFTVNDNLGNSLLPPIMIGPGGTRIDPLPPLPPIDSNGQSPPQGTTNKPDPRRM